MPFLFKKFKKRKGKTVVNLESSVCYVPEFLLTIGMGASA